jgi:hypothetical protein
MARISRIALFVLALLVAMPAAGAKYPNAVEKQIVVTGAPAAAFAEMLGMSSHEPSSLALQLGRGEAWAVYLLKQDTKVPLDNDNDGAPVRTNLIAFSPGPVPSLTISPFWLDQGTALPMTRVGTFSFGSPFLGEALDGNDPWTLILRRLKQESGWTATAYRQFHRCFSPPDATELCIDVYGIKDYADNIEKNGYVIGIVAHPQ